MAREFCAAFNMHATRRTGIRPRAKRRVSLGISVSIKDNSLSRVIIRLFFFVEPFRVKKSSRLCSFVLIYLQSVISRSKWRPRPNPLLHLRALSLRRFKWVVLPCRRPLSHVVKPSDLVFPIEGACRVLSTLKSLLNVNRQRGPMPVFDLQARFSN